MIGDSKQYVNFQTVCSKYIFYGKKYGPPTRIIPHTCTLSDANGKTSRVVKPLWTARQLVQYVDIRSLFHQHKSAVPPTMIMNVISSQGNQTSLMNCANACKKLKLEFFGDDIQQYRLLPDYVSKLRQNDHDVILEMEDKQFTRMQLYFAKENKCSSHTHNLDFVSMVLFSKM